jgi:hypothetical protein
MSDEMLQVDKLTGENVGPGDQTFMILDRPGAAGRLSFYAEKATVLKVFFFPNGKAVATVHIYPGIVEPLVPGVYKEFAVNRLLVLHMEVESGAARCGWIATR